MEGTFFIDIDHSQKERYSQAICGDVFMTRKIAAENRTVIVLADGLGTGVKANILASMTASMALNFMSKNSSISHTADIIMDTLPVDRERRISFCSFTILDIESNGTIHVVEYGNPEIILLRKCESLLISKSEIKIKKRKYHRQKLFYSEFKGEKEDRLIICSDGVTQSGIGTPKYPFGWNNANVSSFVKEVINVSPTISAAELSEKIMVKSNYHDGNRAKDDITAGVVYLRDPRKIMLCSGPPYDAHKDGLLAKNLEQFQGTKVVCGGTTANIIARELNKEIITHIAKFKSDLPPISEMDNIDLVTEGILTIGKTQKMLEEGFDVSLNPQDPALQLCNLLVSHDEVYFVVGTKVNEAHQDPALPVELEIRRNVIKKIAHTLEEKYLKKTIIEYI